MKHFKSILRAKILLLLLTFSGSLPVHADRILTTEEAQHIDSTIRIGLLTCQPSQKIYSLYGHTAIHYIDTDRNIDVAVNYGIFNFNKPFFILRFIFGLTDYEMGVLPFGIFCEEYAYERRGITEQILNIPPEKKLEFAESIARNYLPENREYRYNYFYDNCTTRARDMVLGRLAPSTRYARRDNGPSFRKMIHEYNKERPWARLGNDLLLGLKADRPTTVSEQQFLPYHLMDDFDEATVMVDNDSIPVKLVREKQVVIAPFQQDARREFPLSPLTCSILLAILIVSVTIFESVRSKNCWGFDLVLLLFIGLCGLVLTAMLFSQHPTVKLNLQILMLNPVALACLYPVVKYARKRQHHWFWKFYMICILLFLTGNLLQSYAEGMNILALSLLTRSWIQSNAFNPFKRYSK